VTWPSAWPPPAPAPAPIPPVGSYMTNGKQLVEILESDRSGALGEDVKTILLVPIEARDICKDGEVCEPGRWRRVTPEKSTASPGEERP
jgi:hypothetical protein